MIKHLSQAKLANDAPVKGLPRHVSETGQVVAK